MLRSFAFPVNAGLIQGHQVEKILLAGRLFLAAVFAVSAVAKLADRAGSRQTLRNFRLPPRLVPAAATLLPFVELAAAAALLTASLSLAGAALSLTLLLLFIGGMIHSL